MLLNTNEAARGQGDSHGATDHGGGMGGMGA